jgi:hypothetical protein
MDGKAFKVIGTIIVVLALSWLGLLGFIGRGIERLINTIFG